MSSFINDCLAEEKDLRDQEVRDNLIDQFELGKEDARFGRRPEYNDDIYLEGYFSGLKVLPTDSLTKKIKHYSPRSHFAFGRMDGVDNWQPDF